MGPQAVLPELLAARLAAAMPVLAVKVARRVILAVARVVAVA